MTNEYKSKISSEMNIAITIDNRMKIGHTRSNLS